MSRVKHAVLLRVKSETPQAEIDVTFGQLAGLTEKIPGLLDFSGGPYSSDEGRQQGYTHGFIMTFEDEASRDAYLPHPDHEVVKQRILAIVEGGGEGVLAFDWLE